MLVDSHAHLEFDDFAADQEEILERAEKAGVEAIVSIGTRRQGWDRIAALTHTFDQVYMTAGVHPCDVASDDLSTLEKALDTYAQKPKVVGLGETGLDFFHTPYDQKRQEEAFRLHIKVARKHDLPIVVHSRNAEERTAEMIKEAVAEGPLRVVLHCFAGSLEMAKACLPLGCYFSASGIITFKNAHSLREVFAFLPADKLLVETDAPYLAPSPFRGKRNEPSYVKYTAEALATLRGESFEVLAHQTTKNFHRLFSRVRGIS